MSSTYGVSSDDYERRARSQLDSGTKEGLFYAAFELRCGIEARMDRYLEAHERITRLKRKGWKIGKMAAQLESAFPTKGKLCRFVVIDKVANSIACELVYIPVSAKLKKAAEKLGDYLHCMKQRRDDNDPWWAQTRDMLESTYSELRHVNKGTLMGAPLLHPKTKEVHLEIEVDKAEAQALNVIQRAHSGSDLLTVQIRYENVEATQQTHQRGK